MEMGFRVKLGAKATGTSPQDLLLGETNTASAEEGHKDLRFSRFKSPQVFSRRRLSHRVEPGGWAPRTGVDASGISL